MKLVFPYKGTPFATNMDFPPDFWMPCIVIWDHFSPDFLVKGQNIKSAEEWEQYFKTLEYRQEFEELIND